MKRLVVAALTLVGFVGVFARGGVGTTLNQTNGVGSFAVESSPLALLGSMLIVIAYFVALEPENVSGPATTATTGRRAFAWLVDFFASLAALSASLALLPLAAEGIAAGRFAWSFQRSEVTAQDWALSLAVVALAFVGMAFYWAVPVVRGGQTIGQSLVGLQVVSATSQQPPFGRVFLRGLMQPFAPLLWLGKLASGKYWHDELAGTKVLQARPT